MLTKRTRLAAVFVASLALTAIGAPAHAAPASLLSVGPGSIVADGAAVDVPITFVCDSDPSLVIATPLMELSQRVRGGRIAHGFGNDEVTCTRQAQTVTIRIIPGAMAFNPGEAVVSVTLLTCKVQFQCAIAAFDNEIELSSTEQTLIPSIPPECTENHFVTAGGANPVSGCPGMQWNQRPAG